MKPIEFKEANVVFAKDQPEYRPLPAFRGNDSRGLVVTKWQLSPEEIEQVKQTGCIYLSMLTFGSPLQPVLLTTELPEDLIQSNMKKYIGTKEVKAMPCTLGDFIAKTGRNPYQNDGKMHGNDEEGYLVEYQDGYQSWSPKEVFNKAYKCSETFLDRLHNEMRDLYAKMDKLVPFIDSGKIDEVVTDSYQNHLLRLQQRIMSRYLNVLECRIGRLDGSPEAPLHQMTFGDAIEVLKQGGVIRRRGWNGKGLCVFKQVPAHITSEIIPKMQSLPQDAKKQILKHTGFISYKSQCLIYNEGTGQADSWVPSISDIFADDWEIVVE